MKNDDYLTKKISTSQITIRLKKNIYINLLIRTEYEQLPVKTLLRFFIDGYLDKDIRICGFIDDKIKSHAVLHKKSKVAQFLKKKQKKEEEIKKNFGLNKNEINDLYDELEEDTSGL